MAGKKGKREARRPQTIDGAQIVANAKPYFLLKIKFPTTEKILSEIFEGSIQLSNLLS
jgi:hypothetical protein